MADDDLSSLDVETLRYLGGVRDTCTAALTCVAHGLHVPCEQCHVEDLRAAVCRLCGGRVEGGVVASGEHACASVAQFTATGVVAFADEARATLLRQALERAHAEAASRRADEERAANAPRHSEKEETTDARGGRGWNVKTVLWTSLAVVGVITSIVRPDYVAAFVEWVFWVLIIVLIVFLGVVAS